MSVSDEEGKRRRISYFVPDELQRHDFHLREIFSELADRGLPPVATGGRIAQPWCRWRGISTYLGCVAYACRAANALPTGRALDLSHVAPGQFYSAGIIFFAQALLDNIAVWMCDALPLPVRGGDRHFLSSQFRRELQKKEPAAGTILARNKSFVDEVNLYRQIWIHSLTGGALPISDIDPFENPETASKYLGVPIDPAISPDTENYRARVEQCASRHGGRYVYTLGEFADGIFNRSSTFYLDWLRFALDQIKK